MSRNKLIIDTNLLLLIVIGAVEEGRHIKNSNRLNKFTRDDYDLILKFMINYNNVCITPYIATEVSNLIDLTGHARTLAFEISRELFTKFEEIDTNIAQDVDSISFINFGITDCALIRLSASYSILTDDNRLLPALFELGQDYVIPFEIIRSAHLSRTAL